MGNFGGHDIDHRDTEGIEMEIGQVGIDTYASCSVFSASP